MSKTTDCAVAITTVLTKHGQVYAADLLTQIEALGADPTYFAVAKKYMRDHGVALRCQKAGPNSYYEITSDRQVANEMIRRIQREAYSEQVSMARSIQSKDRRSVAVRDDIVASAIALGRGLGKSLAEVVNECDTLVP